MRNTDNSIIVQTVNDITRGKRKAFTKLSNIRAAMAFEEGEIPKKLLEKIALDENATKKEVEEMKESFEGEILSRLVTNECAETYYYLLFALSAIGVELSDPRIRKPRRGEDAYYGAYKVWKFWICKGMSWEQMVAAN